LRGFVALWDKDCKETQTGVADMSRQIKTRRVKLSTIMGRADFLMGMKDAAQGKPIRDHWDNRTRSGVTNEQWSYERGRLFFFWLKGNGLSDLKIKDGRTVTYAAQVQYAEACMAGAIL
jgi:hypothetical protein